MPPNPVALEGNRRALQPRVQAQAVKHADRNELALGIARRMAGMFQVVAVDGPDGAAGQFGKCAQPVARLQEPIEEFIGTGGHFGHHGGAATGMERIEPGGAGERFAGVLPTLEEVASGVAVAEDPQEAPAQELCIAEFQGVPPASAVVSQQPEGWLEK